MGIYAETSGASVTCKNAKVAGLVYKKLKEQAKKSDEYSNDFAKELEQDGSVVYFKADSGRIQNLEWQIDAIWELVKDIKGVKELQAPFLVEDNGVYYSND